MTRHGTQTRYKAGCDCEPCMRAHDANERARARRAERLAAESPPVPQVAAPPDPTPPPVATQAPPVPPPPTVDTASAVELLRSLVALGHHPRELSEDSRLDVPRLLSWQEPALAGWVIARILKTYANYRWRPGRYPNIAAAAIRKGWTPPRRGDTDDDEPDDARPPRTPPLAGRNQDPPTYRTVVVPDPPKPARGRWSGAERVDAVRYMAGLGAGDPQIAEQLCVSEKHVRRLRRDNDIPPGQPDVDSWQDAQDAALAVRVGELAGLGWTDREIGVELEMSTKQVQGFRLRRCIPSGMAARVKDRQREQAS